MKGVYKKHNEPVSVENAMRPYLEQMQKSGVDLFLDGEAVRVDEIIRHTVQEPCTYMADYVLGEHGDVKQIRFDRVDCQ